jgi:lipid II:glycine glycyltransferase (peptidoglycan interpeptide bridge formation enzyme)
MTVATHAPVIVTGTTTAAPADWNSRTVDPPGGHVMQGTAWADHRRSQGASPRFVTFSDGAAALVVLRRRRLAPGLVASARKGPILGDRPPEAIADRAAALADAVRDLGATDLFVDPEVDADPGYAEAMARAGFEVTAEVQPSIHVMRLRLPPGGDADALQRSFAKSTRQRIRAAREAGTTVRIDEAGDRLAGFGDLLVARAEDLHIDMRPDLGYLAFWRRLIDARLARLYVAEHDGELLGGVLVYVQGGGLATAYSADDATRRRARPGTMHLVRATLLGDAVRDGATHVDLGGVDLPGRRTPPKPGDPNHGLYEHKASFGARWVEREPARRIVLRPWADRVGRATGTMARRVAALRAGR